MTTDLDTFEAQLLSELRATVAARTVDRPLPQQNRSRRVPRRVAAACGGVAAAVVGALLVPGVLASPAYAVQDGPGGLVEVQVNRLEDAAGLQRALADQGVNAEVQYLGDSMKCTPGRFSQAKAASDTSTRFTVGNGIYVVLDRRDVAHGETVVIAASRIPDGVYAEVGIANGSVKDCHPIPLPQGD